MWYDLFSGSIEPSSNPIMLKRWPERPGFFSQIWDNKFFAWHNRLIPRMFPVKLFGFLIRRSFEEKAVSSLLLEKKVS